MYHTVPHHAVLSGAALFLICHTHQKLQVTFTHNICFPAHEAHLHGRRCNGVIAVIALAMLPLSLHWLCCPHCIGIVYIAVLALLLHWLQQPHCAAVVTVVAAAMVSHSPSCPRLPWLVVAPPLIAPFSLHCCLSMCSLCLLSLICLLFSLADCCITFCCAASASRCLLMHRHLSLMCQLVVVLPLIVQPLPCVSSPHATTSPNMPAGCCITTHHALLSFA
jgi:hypothetical protein